MINDKTSLHDSRLRKEFQRALQDNKCGNVVDDLLAIVKRDYILVAKEDCSCSNCFNFVDNTRFGGITSVPYYCKYYQRRIDHFHMDATDCSHYFSGSQEAKNAMAKVHYDLTGEDYYD